MSINSKLLAEKREKLTDEKKDIIFHALKILGRWALYLGALALALVGILFWFVVEVMLRPFREEK